MVHVKLRLDLNEKIDKDLIEYYLALNYTSYAYCYETGKTDNNPHCHAWFEMTHPNIQALRMSIKKIFNPSKGEYSVKNLPYTNETQWSQGYPLAYLAYLHKEGGVVICHNIPEDVIAQAEVMSTEIKDDFNTRRRERQTVNDRCNEKLDKIMLDYPDFDHTHLIQIMRRLLESFVSENEDLPRAFQIDNAFTQYFARKSKTFLALYSERRLEAILGRPKM